MPVEDISIGQILTVVCFIALLILLQLYVNKNKSSIRGKWSSNKRIEILETSRLGPTEKLQILKIDNQEYLYFFTKGNQPVIVPQNKIRDKNPTNSNRVNISPTPTNKITPPIEKIQGSGKQPKVGKPDSKIMQAISRARKLNPKVSFNDI